MKFAHARWALMVTAVLLTACAGGPRVLDSQVQSVVTTATQASTLRGARYRFERLPLQASQPDTARTEALAAAALARAGLVRDEAHPRISVQASVHVTRFWADPWGAPWPGYYGPGRFYLGLGGGWRGAGFMFGAPWWWDSPAPAYAREASLVMRDLQSGQVLYETRARHDGPWHDTDALIEALFSAALHDFPAPPAGWRQVRVPLTPQTLPQTPAPTATPATPAPAVIQAPRTAR